MPSNYLSSWYGTALHMGLGPLLGLIRICTLENWINQPQLKATWEGLEAFWDLGQEPINQRTVSALKTVTEHTYFLVCTQMWVCQTYCTISWENMCTANECRDLRGKYIPYL